MNDEAAGIKDRKNLRGFQDLYYLCDTRPSISMITDRDTNKVYFSRRITWYKAWPGLKAVLDANGVNYALLDGTRDIWARDYMPVQIEADRFISYVYDPDYLQGYKDRMTDWSVIPDPDLKGGVETTNLILDGGNIVKCRDFVIMTDKVFLENERIGFSSDRVNDELKRLFGDVVIVPWNREDKWDFCGHADGLVRQVEGNTVLLNNLCNHEESSRHREKILEIFRERNIEYIELDYGPDYHGVNDWAYLNFLRVGDIIFMPTIERPDVDGEALRQLSAIYGCKVVPVPFLSIVKANGMYGGGALNCVSWTMKQ